MAELYSGEVLTMSENNTENNKNSKSSITTSVLA
jgi:hypothetical protein